MSIEVESKLQASFYCYPDAPAVIGRGVASWSKPSTGVFIIELEVAIYALFLRSFPVIAAEDNPGFITQVAASITPDGAVSALRFETFDIAGDPADRSFNVHVYRIEGDYIPEA